MIHNTLSSSQSHGNELDLRAEMCRLLQRVGPGHMMNTAYDTAWVARLHKLGEPMAEQALNWLRQHQLADGSWGATVPEYHHDRVLCTLSAVIALAERGLPEDKPRIEKAVAALRFHQDRLQLDSAGQTIAFEMLFPTLMAEASTYQLIQRENLKHIQGQTTPREVKLSQSPGNRINRFTTMAFSAEMAGPNGLHLLDTNNLQEEDGSVGYSPSATAYFVSNFSPDNLIARSYLRTVNENGGFPNVAPFDTFEQAWTLWNLALTNIKDSELDALCEPLLNSLEGTWVPGKGVGFAAGYAAKDSDGTSVVYDVLTNYGRSVDFTAVLSYEEQEHFRCFALEANPSISANIHVLGALYKAGLSANHSAVKKVTHFLQTQKKENAFWLDKWHTSPYYTTSHAIIANQGIDKKLVTNTIQWIVETQKHDGSWGYYAATAEETAYCLQALVVAKRYGEPIPQAVLKRGAAWLEKHINDPYPPLWIGKCLYAPLLVIRSAVVSALLMVEQVKSG